MPRGASAGKNFSAAIETGRMGAGRMRLNRIERAVIAVTALLLAVMAGWFLSARSSRAALRSALPAPSGEAVRFPSRPGAEDGQGDALLDLNAAGLEELMALPGIGQTRAQAILDWREENGPFRYVEELVEVPGIGEGLLEDLTDYITVRNGGP